MTEGYLWLGDPGRTESDAVLETVVEVVANSTAKEGWFLEDDELVREALLRGSRDDDFHVVMVTGEESTENTGSAASSPWTRMSVEPGDEEATLFREVDSLVVFWDGSGPRPQSIVSRAEEQGVEVSMVPVGDLASRVERFQVE